MEKKLVNGRYFMTKNVKNLQKELHLEKLSLFMYMYS